MNEGRYAWSRNPSSFVTRVPLSSFRKHSIPPVKCGMKCRPSAPLEFARPVGYRLDLDMSSSATLWTQPQATTTHRPLTSPSRLWTRLKNPTPVARLSFETSTSRTMESLKTVTRPAFSAGAMCTSAELYFATTSQPAMQFPQKWQAGRVGVDTDSVAFLT